MARQGAEGDGRGRVIHRGSVQGTCSRVKGNVIPVSSPPRSLAASSVPCLPMESTSVARLVATVLYGPGVKPTPLLLSNATEKKDNVIGSVSALCARAVGRLANFLGYSCDNIGNIMARAILYLSSFMAVWMAVLLLVSFYASDTHSGAYDADLVVYGVAHVPADDASALSTTVSMDPGRYYDIDDEECIKGAVRVRIDPSTVSMYRIQQSSWLKDQHLRAPCRPISESEIRRGVFYLDKDREHDAPSDENSSSSDADADDHIPLTHHYITINDMIHLNEMLLDQNSAADFVSPKHYKIAPGGITYDQDGIVTAPTPSLGKDVDYWRPSDGFNPCMTTVRVSVPVNDIDDREHQVHHTGPASGGDTRSDLGDHFREAVDDENMEKHSDSVPGDEYSETGATNDTAVDIYLTFVNPVIPADIFDRLENPHRGGRQDSTATKVRVDFSEGDIYYPKSFVIPNLTETLEVTSASILYPGKTERHHLTGQYEQILFRTSIAALKGFTFTTMK